MEETYIKEIIRMLRNADIKMLKRIYTILVAEENKGKCTK